MRVLYNALALVVAATASPFLSSTSLGRHVVHESRNDLPHKWEKRNKLHGDTVLPVRIGLAQQNLHRADEFINQVSHPSSPDYGRHWSAEHVARTFASSPNSLEVVKPWLSFSGIAPERVTLSKSLSWLTFDAIAREVESLLHTDYFTYQHLDGSGHIACEDYSIPAALTGLIDIITPTIYFDHHTSSTRQGQRRDFGPKHHEAMKLVKKESREQDLLRRRNTSPTLSAMRGKIGSALDGSNPKQGKGVGNAVGRLSRVNFLD